MPSNKHPAFNFDEHKKRHELLHQNLDELAADFLSQNGPGRMLGNTTIMELLEWSHRQTVTPETKHE